MKPHVSWQTANVWEVEGKEEKVLTDILLNDTTGSYIAVNVTVSQPFLGLKSFVSDSVGCIDHFAKIFCELR